MNQSTAPNNRKMAATFKKLGFEKSPLQMTRVGLTYRLKDDESNTLFTFGKGMNDNIQVSAPHRVDFPSLIIFTESKWAELQRDDWIWPHLVAFHNQEALNMRTILLAMAAGYADMVNHERAN